MTKNQAIEEINKAFEPAFANYIITALAEGATVSDNCINQQATLDAIIKELGIRNENYLLQSEKVIYNVVKNMPPAAPTRWIPISKTTQPKENEAVLITYKFSGKRITTKAYRQSNGWEFENGGWIPNELVVAWQPLPKPYDKEIVKEDLDESLDGELER